MREVAALTHTPSSLFPEMQNLSISLNATPFAAARHRGMGLIPRTFARGLAPLNQIGVRRKCNIAMQVLGMVGLDENRNGVLVHSSLDPV